MNLGGPTLAVPNCEVLPQSGGGLSSGLMSHGVTVTLLNLLEIYLEMMERLEL